MRKILFSFSCFLEKMLRSRGWRSGSVLCADLRNGWGLEVAAFLRLRTLSFGKPYHDVNTVHEGQETDCYDTPFSHYLVSQSNSLVADGGFRLNPTTLPYMAQLWPDMWSGDLPCSRHAYEITRGALGDWLNEEERLLVKRELVCALLEFGLAMKIEVMIGVSLPRYWQSIFTESGWPVELVGPAKLLGGDMCTAGLLRVTPEALARVRAVTGIRYSALSMKSSSGRRARGANAVEALKSLVRKSAAAPFEPK
jgi:N-acyl-L-homoserine lactone synthetase